jgi:acyl-[acyl-carrier-protein] desaturase
MTYGRAIPGALAPGTFTIDSTGVAFATSVPPAARPAAIGGLTMELDSAQLLAELEPAVAANLDRHLGVAKEWMPHEYVPWSLGRDFADLGGDAWSVDQSSLSPIARTALEVNLLTEDNLPSYHREVERAFGRDSAWGTWVNRWTAEEGRHAFCIRDYLLVTRGVDPVELERARMDTMESGYDSGDKPLLNVCAYVSFQELATRVSHRNTGRYTKEPIAEKLLTRVAMDENLHMIFYRNIVTAALELAPNQTIRAITDEVVDFQMPGSIIPGFARKAVQMAKAGIYDLRIHHDDIVMPLLRQWGVFELEGLDSEGERARTQLASTVDALDVRAARFVEQREEAAAKKAARQST